MAAYNLFKFGDGIAIAKDSDDAIVCQKNWIMELGFKNDNLQFYVVQPTFPKVFYNIPLADLSIEGVAPADKNDAIDKLKILFLDAGGAATPTQITIAEAQTLLNDKTVQNGVIYFITNADQVNTGLILQGMPNGYFSLHGEAGFLNADYQQNGNYDDTADVSGVAYNGQQGIWLASNEGGYHTGDVVIYNGLHWQVIDSGQFSGNSPNNNGAAYQLLEKEETVNNGLNLGYIQEFDYIQYDIPNQRLLARKDKRGNEFIYSDNYGWNSATFQWGNDECRNNIMNGGAIHNYNQTTSFQRNIVNPDATLIAYTSSGEIARNILEQDSNINASNNTQNILGCSFKNANVTLDMETQSIEGCIFENVSGIDLSASTVSYVGKTITPYISTFDAVIECANILDIPEYLGIIYINNGSNGTIEGFSTYPSFERTFYVNNNEPVTFLDSGELKFPTPSTGTTIQYNDYQDFIKFLYRPASGVFIQTASEQY